LGLEKNLELTTKAKSAVTTLGFQNLVFINDTNRIKWTCMLLVKVTGLKSEEPVMVGVFGGDCRNKMADRLPRNDLGKCSNCIP